MGMWRLSHSSQLYFIDIHRYLADACYSTILVFKEIIAINLHRSGSIPAPSTSLTPLSWQKLSIPCTFGTRDQAYAMHIFQMCQLSISSTADGLLVAGHYRRLSHRTVWSSIPPTGKVSEQDKAGNDLSGRLREFLLRFCAANLLMAILLRTKCHGPPKELQRSPKISHTVSWAYFTSTCLCSTGREVPMHSTGCSVASWKSQKIIPYSHGSSVRVFLPNKVSSQTLPEPFSNHRNTTPLTSYACLRLGLGP